MIIQNDFKELYKLKWKIEDITRLKNKFVLSCKNIV